MTPDEFRRERDTPNPHMLGIARDIRGMTIEELAERSGVPIERLRLAEECEEIHFFQSDDAPPPKLVLTLDEVKRVAKATDYPPSFFFQRARRWPLAHWTAHCTRSGGRS